MPSDITKTGPVALRGLNRQNSNPSLEELPIGYFGKHSNRYVSPSEIPVGLQAAEVGYGNSQYDDAITSPNQFDEINEIRYNEQPWYDTLANGVAKMYGNFATTFLSSIIGIPYGIEEAIRQQRWSALWDNDVTQALGDADDWMEEHFTNYRSQKQQDSPWYDPSNLFSMNFIADDIIKNNGFMMGSVASMAVGSGEIGLLSKALGYVGDIGKIGKTTQNVVSSLFAATGEGMIEAKQGVRERNKAERLNVDNALTPQYNSLQMEDAEADEEYARTKGLDVRYDSAGRPMDMAYERYMQKKRDIQARRQELDNRKAAAYQQIEESGQEMGNTILLANQGLLTMGNLLQFSKGMTKSFDLARHAAQTSSKIAKPAFATVSRVSKNLADGYKIGGSKAAGRLWAGTKGFLTEGAEEMNQQFIQGASGAAFNEGDVNDYWKARLDPDAYRSTTESLYDFGTILDRGFRDSWGSIDQWEQFLVGGLTGAMGSYMPTKLFNQDKSKKIYDPRRYGEWQGGAVNEILDYNKQYNDLEGNVKDLNDILGQQDFSARVQRLAAHAYHEGNKTQAAENNDKKWWKDEDDKQTIHDIQSFLRAGRLGDLRAIYDQIGSEWSDEDIEGLKKATTREVTADEDKKKFDDAKDAEIAEIARQQDALQEQLDVMKDAGSSAADIGDISSRIAALEAEKARLNQEKDAYKGQRRFIGAFIGEDGEATMTNDKIREVMKHNSKELNRKIDSYLESVAAVNEDTGGRLSKEQEDNLAYLHNLGKESNRRFLKTISERRGDMPGKFLLKTKKTPEQLTKEYPVSDLAFAVNDDTPKGYVEADTSLMTDNDFANFFMREVMWGGNISPEYGETADEKAQREKEANDKTLSDEERKKRAMERFTAKLKEVEKQQEADRSEQQLTNVKRMKDIFVKNYRKNNNATVDEALKAWKELMQDVKDASDLLNQAGQYRATLSEYMSNPSKVDEDKKKEETKAEKKAKKEQTKGLSTRDLSNRDDLDDLLAQAQQDNDVDLINKIRKAKVLREKRANIDAAENDPNYSGLDPDDREAAFDILRQQIENDIDDSGTYDHEMTIKELADKVSDVDDALVDDYVYNHAVVNIDPQTGAKTLSLKKDVINSTEEGQLAQFEAENPEEYNNQIELLKGKIRNAIKPIDDKIKSILSKIDVDDIDEEGTAKLSKYGDQIKEGEDLPTIEPEKKNDRNAPVQTVPNKEEVPAEKKPVDGIGEEAVITLDMQQSTENGMQTAFDGGQHPWFSVLGRFGYHTNEPYSATLKKLIDDPNISEEKKAQYRKQYKRAVAVEEFLEKSGAYTRVENGGAPRKGRVKFKVFKSVNTKAEDFVIFMTDEQGRILGDLPSSDVDIDPNTERRTGLAELYEEARKQLEESGSDELELKGIESEIDFNYIGKPQYQEQRQHVNDLFGKNNFTIAIKVADSSSESPVSFLDTGKKSLQGKLEKDAIKAPLTGSLGQPYILIPTSQSGSKNNFGKGYWAVPIATPTFGEIDKDSVFYKTVRQTLEQIRDGKLSETEAKTKLGELFGLANFHVNFDSAESRKGAGIRATTYIRQDGSEKGAPHTLHVGDRASMDVDAILNELGRFFINVSNSKINSTGIYTVVEGTSYTYNQMIGEIATTNAARPHTVNDWFTIKPVEKKGDKWVISETPTQRISYPTGGDNAIFNVSIPYQDGTSHLWTISPRDWVVRDEKGRAIYVGDSVHSDAEIAVAAVQVARAFGRYYLKDMTKPYVVQVGNQARLFDPKTNTFKTAKELEESPKYRKGTSFNSLEEEYDYLMSREAEMLEGFEMAARERAAAKRNKPFAELTPEEKGALLDRALIAEGINGKYEREPVVKDFVKALKEGKTQTTNLKKAEEQYNIEKNAEPTVSPQQIGQDMVSHMQSAGIDIEVVDDASKAAEGIEDAQLLAIGEKGARSLDAAEEATTRIDNLAVADEMEKAGKPAYTIKLATGWERGADGKWRYEIVDVELHGGILYNAIHNNTSISLQDLLGKYKYETQSTKQFFAAYPNLRNTKVIFREGNDKELKGEYNPVTNTLSIYPFHLGVSGKKYIDEEIRRNIEKTLAHEIQHAIQDIEGFSQGGNPGMAKAAYLKQKGWYDEYLELSNSYGEYNKLRQKILSEDAEYVKYENIARRLDFLFDGISPNANEEEVDQYIKQEIPDWKKGVNYDALATERRQKLLKEHKEELEEAHKKDDETAKKLNEINASIPDSYDAYRRLAGEVESRAVSRRVGLSRAQRRNSLIIDEMYEDVPKVDLIFLSSAGNAQLSSSELSEMEQIKKAAKANGTFMKAPNGKDTNLTEKQWLQVRTKNFINWFGDWINDPANASKVVDENGEPLVVYHGSRKADDIRVFHKAEYDKPFISEEKIQEAESTRDSIEWAENVLNTFMQDPLVAFMIDEKPGAFVGESVYRFKTDAFKSMSQKQLDELKNRFGTKEFVDKYCTGDGMNSKEFLDLTDKNSGEYAESAFKISTFGQALREAFRIIDTKNIDAVNADVTLQEATIYKDNTISKLNGGIWFTPHPEYAEYITAQPKKIAVFLNIRNLQEPKEDLNSGVAGRYFALHPEADGITGYDSGTRGDLSFAVKDSNQIKSATDNNGMFSTENPDINMLKVDGKILGFEHNGKLYLQKDALNPNLPMHEYTHLWDRVIKTVDPRLWKRGKEIMKSEAADLWKQIAEDENYGKRWEKEGKTAEELEDLIASEVHARLTGKGFEEYASKKKETFAKLKQWILDACKTIAKTLGISDAEVEKLTLADWNNMTVRDFMEKSITMQTIQEEAQKAENIKQSEAIVAKIKSDSENYVLSDADGKENPQGAYYKDKRTNKLHARVTSVKEGDTRVQPFKETDDEGNKNPWILPSTTIGNAVDEFVRAFFAGEDPEASPLAQNLSESTKEGLRKELQKIKTSLGKWKVVSNGIVASGTIMVKDANGDKIAIRVAGTLDLLLYNPERNEYAIYDMKTHRSPVDNQKELDWAAQLSLYKQLLETKFPELRGKIKALKIVPFSTSGYNANRHHYESDDEGRLISGGEIVKAEVKYDGKTIDLTGKEMNLDISFARPGFKKEYVEGVQNIIVGKPQPKLGEAPKEKVKEGLVKTINKIEGKDSVKTFLKSDYKENPEALKLAEVLDKARADGTLGELCLTTGTMNLLQDMLDTKKIDRIAGYAALAKKGIEVQEEAAPDVEVGEEPAEKSVDAIAEEKGIVTPATRNAWNRLTDENKQKVVQLRRGLNNVKKELRDCQRLGKDPNTAIRGYLHRKADETSGYTVIDMKKELEWLNRVLPRLPKENKIRVIEGLIKCSDGTWSYGQLKQGLIYIASNGKEGTMYHEAFHAVTQWILTDQELDRLYAAARERYGDLDTVTLEEKLADDFMLFTMGYEPSYKKRDLSILQRLWQALKNMFNNTSMIDTLYRDINDGVYANRVLRTENNEFAQIESEDRQVSMKYDFLDKEQKEKLRNNGVNQKQYEVMDTEEKRYLFHCVL